MSKGRITKAEYVERFNEAIEFRNHGKLDQAISRLQMLRSRSVSSLDIARLLITEADCFVIKGELERAQNLLLEARQFGRGDRSINFEVEFETALIERADGNKFCALTRTERILRDFADLLGAPEYSHERAELNANRALLLAETEQYPQALPFLISAHNCQPERPDILYYLARTYFNVGNISEAIGYVSAALGRQEIEPNVKLAARYLLACSYYRTGAFGRTVLVFRELERDIGESHLLADSVYERLSGSSRSVYQMVVDSLRRTGRDDEAVHYANLAKATPR